MKSICIVRNGESIQNDNGDQLKQEVAFHPGNGVIGPAIHQRFQLFVFFGLRRLLLPDIF
jgi:hypothetical protein